MKRLVIVCLVLAGCGSSAPPSPPGPKHGGTASLPAPGAGCVRQRAARHVACIGVERGDGNMDAVTVCDGCVTNADCVANPGGTCVSTGGMKCDAPAAFVCRYPQDACTGCPWCSNDGRGAPVCRTAPTIAPPAMDSGG